MNFFNALLQLDWTARLALAGLALTALGWGAAMIVALFSRRRESKGPRRFEIVVFVLSFLLMGSMTHAGRVMDRKPVVEQTAPAEMAPLNAKRGKGNCASVRLGMKTAQVKTLLGDPSLEQSSEDARGPGASVMLFDDSRCVVYLIHGTVDHIE